MNGETRRFSSATEFQEVRQDTLRQFRQLWEAATRSQRGDMSSVKRSRRAGSTSVPCWLERRHEPHRLAA